MVHYDGATGWSRLDTTEKAHGSPPVVRSPQQQEMSAAVPWPSPKELLDLKSRLDAKEAELCSLNAKLRKQGGAVGELQVMLADGRSLPTDQQAAVAASHSGGTACPLSLLQPEKALLLARWQCLLEDKAQLTALLQLARGRLGDFEPGETPMRDVTCSVITHQLDTPCFSCCFQR